MKKILKLSVGMVLLASLFLTACAPPPPPVSKDQLDTAEMETIQAEKDAAAKATELKELQQEVDQRKADLEAIKEYQKQLDAE